MAATEPFVRCGIARLPDGFQRHHRRGLAGAAPDSYCSKLAQPLDFVPRPLLGAGFEIVAVIEIRRGETVVDKG